MSNADCSLAVGQVQGSSGTVGQLWRGNANSPAAAGTARGSPTANRTVAHVCHRP
jgi:hypothetical protein